MSTELVLSGISGICTLAALGLFVRAILKRTSRPHLLAWIIRLMLVVVAFLSQAAAGATYSLALSGSQLIGCGTVVVLMITRQSLLGRVTAADRLAVGAAMVGVVVWIWSGNPLYGLLGAIVSDTAATALGIHASIVRGTRDSMAFWMFAFLAGLSALLATDMASVVIVLAPLFSCVNAGANILALVYVRRRGTISLPAPESASIS